MTEDVSKAAGIRVSTRGPKAASGAANPLHAAGAVDGGQEDRSANRECRNPRSFDIAFRELRDEDLPLMHRWLNDPAVVQWWEGADVSWPAVVSRYGSDHSTRVEHWIALIQGDPVGWAQCYGAADVAEGEAHHWKGHLELRDAAGIDYLVREPTRRGRGTGSAMIRAFVRDASSPGTRSGPLPRPGPSRPTWPPGERSRTPASGAWPSSTTRTDPAC